VSVTLFFFVVRGHVISLVCELLLHGCRMAQSLWCVCLVQEWCGSSNCILILFHLYFCKYAFVTFANIHTHWTHI